MTATIHAIKPRPKRSSKQRAKKTRFPCPVPPIKRRYVEDRRGLSEQTKALLLAAHVIGAHKPRK